MTDFDAAINYLSIYGHQKRRTIANAFAILDKAVAQGWIWNVDFNEVKEDVNRALAKAAEKIVYGESYKAIRDHAFANIPNLPTHALGGTYVDFELGGSDVQLSSLKSAAKKLNADRKAYGDHPGFDDMGALIESIIPVAKALETLKPNIKKGRKTSETPSASFVPTFDPNDFATISAKFKDVVADLRDHQIAGVTAYVNQIVDKYLADAEKPLDPKVRIPFGTDHRTPYYVYYEQNYYLQVSHILRDVLDGDYLKDAAYGAKVRKYAEEAVDAIHAQYIHKNATKLAGIVGKKDLKSITLLSAKASAFNIESEMRFDFADGSSFRVVNQTVWGTSPRGSEFVRFPTTFHDVIKADGSRMSSPSEEKMNAAF